MKKILMFSIILATLSSCVFDKSESRMITIVNNSNSQIFVFYTKQELNKITDKNDVSYKILIKPNAFAFKDIVRPTWEEYAKSCADNKIRLYIINKDSIDKHGWKDIYKKNIYNKKYVLSVNDLEKIDWQVTYE